MSKATEYVIRIDKAGCWLAKHVPSLEEKGQMSQDRREITKAEIYKMFVWYLHKYCDANRTNTLRVMDGRRLVFEARRPRRKGGSK